MIAILNNLISLLIIPVGFGLDNLILFLTTFMGRIIVFSSIIFFEYLTVKSIINV